MTCWSVWFGPWKTRRMPFEFVANTWDDDIVPFREAFINVETYGLFDAQMEKNHWHTFRHWEELCAIESYPINSLRPLNDMKYWFNGWIQIYLRKRSWRSNSTPVSDRGLRDQAIKIIMDHLIELRGGEKTVHAAFQDSLLKFVPQFSYDLILAIMNKSVSGWNWNGISFVGKTGLVDLVRWEVES